MKGANVSFYYKMLNVGVDQQNRPVLYVQCDDSRGCQVHAVIESEALDDLPLSWHEQRIDGQHGHLCPFCRHDGEICQVYARRTRLIPPSMAA